MKRVLILCLILVGSISGCVTNPYSGRDQLLFYSPAHMTALGIAAYSEMTGPARTFA